MRGIYKEDKKIIICIFITSFILFLIIPYFLLCVMDIKKIIEPMENFTTNIITFISIAFGFYLTSLSVIFSSKYIGMLNTTDERKPDQKKFIL